MPLAGPRVLIQDAENLVAARGRRMGRRVFEAGDVAPHRRLRAWQEFISDHLADVDLIYPDDVPTKLAFGGSLTVDRRDRVSVGHVRSSYQRLVRTRERVKRAARECLLATFVERGKCAIRQDDRTALLGPGDFCLYDSTRPYQIDVPGELSATIVMIDLSLIEPRAAFLSGTCAVSFKSADPAGGVAFRYWHDLLRHSHVFDDAGLLSLVRSGLGIIETAAADFAPAGSSLSTYPALLRAKAYLAAHAGDSTLSAARAAQAMGLSLRRLQELFQDDGTTITRYLRTFRLNAARMQLQNKSMHHASIASIAALHGFTDQSAFSRDFKTLFKVTPSRFRGRPPRT